MSFQLMRAKTFDLFESKLNQKQIENSELNKKEASEGLTVLKSYPRRVVLELTNACNFNCIMCGRSEAGFKPTFLGFEDIDRLADVFEHCEEVTLFGWGEPTVHPQFAKIVSWIDQFPVRKYFVTNGSTLKKIENILFEHKVDIMAVSLDGATAETNNRIRRNADFGQIVSDLSRIVKIRNENGYGYPYINFVQTLMKSNLQELPDLVRLAAEIGIEEVKAVYLTVFSGDLLHESLWDCRGEVQDVFNIAMEIAKENNIRLKLPFLQGEDVAGEEYHKICYVGWRDLFVGSDKYVRPCQSTPLKYMKIDAGDFMDSIWNSREFQDFRKGVNSAGLMPDHCRKCYQSSHANFNRKSSFIFDGTSFAPEWEKIS